MGSKRTGEELARSLLPGAVCPAVIHDVGDSAGRLVVRLLGEHGPGALVDARSALAFPYRPSEGDRVLIAAHGAEHYLVGVLHAAQTASLQLPDGASAEISEQGALELRDPEGRLLIRYDHGAAEICAPQGNLTLAAPGGKVLLRSGTDVEIDARRDVTQRAGRKAAVQVGSAAEPQLTTDTQSVKVQVDRAELQAKSTQVAVGKATMLARSLFTTAQSLSYNVERYELTADRLVEKTRDAFRDVGDLLQIRAGRVRTLVEDVYTMFSRRTVMISREDTSIDGKRILLG